MSGHRTARVLVYTHRWLGIVSGVLFVIWFVSGIVMMYARMPELSTTERLARLPAINSAHIRTVPPAPAEGDITRLTIGTLEGRPVFRVTARGRTDLVFADTGDALFASIDIRSSDCIAPAYYATMGFAVPAALGFVHARHPSWDNRRTSSREAWRQCGQGSRSRAGRPGGGGSTGGRGASKSWSRFRVVRCAGWSRPKARTR